MVLRLKKEVSLILLPIFIISLLVLIGNHSRRKYLSHVNYHWSLQKVDASPVAEDVVHLNLAAPLK